MGKKDVIVIGAGQSGLAMAYYLRRSKLDYLVLDKNKDCGGSWPDYWDSLTLFSTARHSSLPGWMMPTTENKYPTRDEVVQYLCQYEKRYSLKIKRGVDVQRVEKNDDHFILDTTAGQFQAEAIVAATGRFRTPFIPEIKNLSNYQGIVLHSSEYRNPGAFIGKKTLVIGEGNSGAQIVADLINSDVAVTWAYKNYPEFLPEDIDGEVLFDHASAKYYAQKKGEAFNPKKLNLGNIVQTPVIRKALQTNKMAAKGRIAKLNEQGVYWETGESENFDCIILCTGYLYNTSYLKGLINTDNKGKIKTDGTKAINSDGLWMIGYGNWTGFASATLIGVGRSARTTLNQIEDYLK